MNPTFYRLEIELRATNTYDAGDVLEQTVRSP